MNHHPSHHQDDLSEPPASAESTILVGILGVLLCGVAAASALFQAPPDSSITGIRVAITVLGLIIAGCAITMRPQGFEGWGLFTVAAVLAIFGFPQSWDSFRLVARVAAAVSGVGLLLVAAPIKIRMGVISAVVLVHFGGIMTAVTNPQPQPWLGGQLWMKAYRPYLQFVYLNNAYQFYSPDPGPASELWFMIEYRSNDPETPLKAEEQKKWFKIARRPEDMRDPLGQAYYRRLSLTEYATHLQMNYVLPPYLSREIEQNRLRPGQLSIHPQVHINNQYREPAEAVRIMRIPSYIRHVAHIHQREDARIVNVKLYRVLHSVVPLEQYVGVLDRDTRINNKLGPFDPTTYSPYFMGDYNIRGELHNPKAEEDAPYIRDPLLYWLIPILESEERGTYRRNRESKDMDRLHMDRLSDEEYGRWFHDAVMQHAGSSHRLRKGGNP